MALQEELKSQGDFLFKYRSYLPILLLILGLYVVYLHASDTTFDPTVAYRQLLYKGAVWVGLMGLLIRVITVGYTPANTSGRNTSKGQSAEVLNTTGMYSMVRNPLYLGNYFMWLGVAMLTQSIWFVLVFSLVFWIYYERIVFAEESFLRVKFGEDYLNWAKDTPPFLPKKLSFLKPDFPFSWKKVLRKEKNGLFALFFLVYLFHLTSMYFSKGVVVGLETWQGQAAVFSGIIYFVLKILKNQSGVLTEKGR